MYVLYVNMCVQLYLFTSRTSWTLLVNHCTRDAHQDMAKIGDLGGSSNRI